MQSCWLVALPFCNDQFFHAVACKRAYFLCRIAKSDNIRHFALLYCKDASNKPSQYANCWSHEATTTMIAIFMLYCDEWATTTTFFYVILQGVNNDTTIHTSGYARSCGVMMKCINQILYAGKHKRQQQWAYPWCCIAREATILFFWCCEKQLYCQGACKKNKLTIARHQDATIKHFICCWLQGWWQQAYLGTSYCKKQWCRWLIAT
jgi:hypothetical protein